MKVISLKEILTYFNSHWVIWLFTLMGSALGYVIRRLQQQQKVNLRHEVLYLKCELLGIWPVKTGHMYQRRLLCI